VSETREQLLIVKQAEICAFEERCSWHWNFLRIRWRSNAIFTSAQVGLCVLHALLIMYKFKDASVPFLLFSER
jgi:hypothetical protein